MNVRAHRRISMVMLIALLAVIVRSVLPVGYMFDYDREGAFSVVICTEHGSTEVLVDDGGGELPKKPIGREHACSFAAFAALPSPDVVISPIRQDRVFVDLDYPTPAEIVVGSVLPPLPARGPPSFS